MRLILIVFSSQSYTFHALIRRETAALEGAIKWDYDCDDRSEPASAWADADRIPSGSPKCAEAVGRWLRQQTAGRMVLAFAAWCAAALMS